MFNDERNEIIGKQFTRFVVTVVRNGQKDYIRRANEISKREILVPDMSEYLLSDEFCETNAQQCTDYCKLGDCLLDPILSHTVASLTDRQKHVLYLFAVLDMDCTRIASILNCNPRNIRNVKKTALNKILASWEASDHGL